MKIARTLLTAASLALVVPAGSAVAQRGGHGGGYRGGGFGGGYGRSGSVYRGGYGYRGYGYRGYGYGGYGFGYGLFGLGVLGGYALSYPSYGYGYAPYAYSYEVDPDLYDGAPPPPPPAGYATGGAGYDGADRPTGVDDRSAGPEDGAHCPLFWDQSQRRYVPRCG